MYAIVCRPQSAHPHRANRVLTSAPFCAAFFATARSSSGATLLAMTVTSPRLGADARGLSEVLAIGRACRQAGGKECADLCMFL